MEDDGFVRLAVPVGEDDHVRGPRDAPVTLVEYGDFECPFCVRAYSILKELEARYPRDLRVVFRSYPLDQHRHARPAAEAAEFAADAGRFWEMHDRLYEHHDQLAVACLPDHARALGLDGAALELALRQQTYRPLIDDVKAGGDVSGFPATPAIFLNGVLFEDEPTLDGLASAIDWLLAQDDAKR